MTSPVGPRFNIVVGYDEAGPCFTLFAADGRIEHRLPDFTPSPLWKRPTLVQYRPPGFLQRIEVLPGNRPTHADPPEASHSRRSYERCSTCVGEALSPRSGSVTMFFPTLSERAASSACSFSPIRTVVVGMGYVAPSSKTPMAWRKSTHQSTPSRRVSQITRERWNGGHGKSRNYEWTAGQLPQKSHSSQDSQALRQLFCSFSRAALVAAYGNQGSAISVTALLTTKNFEP